MSLVTKDERGLVVEGTIVLLDESVHVGTPEERARESVGREDPVNVAEEIARTYKEGDRVTITVAKVG